MLTPTVQGKNPLYRKISPEEDRTRDAVDSEPKHYQRAISAPGSWFERMANCVQADAGGGRGGGGGGVV